MIVDNSGKGVESPNSAYEANQETWLRSRVACGGERMVKEYDNIVDSTLTSSSKNLLLPFSPSMSIQQYNFYKSEAEWPGIVAQYAKTIVGGLLRKQPTLVLPKDVPEGAYQWIMDAFTQDSSPLVSFLDSALWEEMNTSRAWVFVDYPVIPDASTLTTDDFRKFKPFPVLLKAESIVNWKVEVDKEGVQQLTRLIIRGFTEKFDENNEFHPKNVDTVWVHEIKDDYYQIREYQQSTASDKVTMSGGTKDVNTGSGTFDLVKTNTNILMNGERLKIIPAWPLNGSIDVVERMLLPIINREIALYNKLSRRNHLLYGAATYTPVVITDLTDAEFQKIVDAGLGSWIKLPTGSTVDMLKTPTEALADMQISIASTIEEMAKMGLRMLSPETEQSGIALEIRNASQTAQLGTLNLKASNQLADIIAFMLNWRYDKEYTSSDIEFTLSADFNPTPLGADWLRLVTEWYQGGLIPRTIWLQILKINDIMPPDYDDAEGVKEINSDELIITQAQQAKDYKEGLKSQTEI